MAEVYPTDSALNALLSEAETGVEYIPTGTVPYYLHFRKLLHRLLLSAKRANDLRLFDEGGLDIGVKAGKFLYGNELVTYAGSTGNALADNKAAIYIYINLAGTLVINEYSAFPDMSAVKHVRLAVVTTASADITSIVDSRDHHSLYVPGNGSDVVVSNYTADHVVTEAESASVFSTYGASGVVTFTLPDPASAGLRYVFSCLSSNQLRIDPQSAIIMDLTGITADKYKYASAIGATMVLVSNDNGDWIVESKTGTWTEEA